MSLLLLLLGCAPDVLPRPPAAPAEVRLQVADAKVDSGQPVTLDLQVWTAVGWTVQTGAPTAEGLELTPIGQRGPTMVGDRELRVASFELTGPDGSYIIAPSAAVATDPDAETYPLTPAPVFIDIGVDGPTGGPMEGFADAPPPEPPPWPWIAAAAGGVLLIGLGAAWWWRRSRRPVPLPPPLPPHEQAILDWEAARERGLDDHSLALALSRILRVAIQGTLDTPATTQTTRELLGALAAQSALDAADRSRAARVLDATDRLKFAREGGGAAFFDALDADFRAVIGALPRPMLSDD